MASSVKSNMNWDCDSDVYAIQISAFCYNGQDNYEAGNLWLSTSGTFLNDRNQISCRLWTTKKENSEKQHILTLSIKDKECFEEISKTCFLLLIAVEAPVRRLTFYREKRELLKWSLNLAVGSQVCVWVAEERVDGVIRFIGAVSNDLNGHMFGIELSPEHEGKGTSNGTFKKKTFFECKEDCAVFVNVTKVEQPTPIGRYSSDSRQKLNYVNESMPKNCPLKLDDRIVWMSDGGPEHGTVRWIGVLPDSDQPRDPSQLTVGVEFDNPVGTGTGRYKSHTLFQTRRQHASLIPILGLIKESDFMCGMYQQQYDFGTDNSFASPFTGIGTFSGMQNSSPVMTDSPVAAGFITTESTPLPDVINTPTPSQQQLLSPRGEAYTATPQSEPQYTDQAAMVSGVQKGRVMPPSIADVDLICGKNKGIQCYSAKCSLEVVTFTMFSYYAYFDTKLFESYEENLSGAIRRVLVEHVVNPMRASSYVSSDKVKKFADLFTMLKSAELAGCAVATVILNEDPVDAVKNILRDLLQMESLISLEDTSTPYYVFAADMPSTSYPFPRVQHLIECAVLHSPAWRLASVPRSVFIVKVDAAHFGRLVPSGRIFPALTLDLSGILLSSGCPCCKCGTEIGMLQCGDCFTMECNSRMTDLPELSSFTYCKECYEKSHKRSDRQNHVPYKFRSLTTTENNAHTVLELFAMISNVNDHFVSFFKAGQGESSAWLMYEPKARRIAGGRNEAYLPEIKRCEDIEKCLSDVHATRKADSLPEIILKMISGLHLCFYRPQK
jgi:hypothetical protein